MCNDAARAALIDKIQSGEMGEISYVRANRLTGRRWMGSMGEKSNNLTPDAESPWDYEWIDFIDCLAARPGGCRQKCKASVPHSPC